MFWEALSGDVMCVFTDFVQEVRQVFREEPHDVMCVSTDCVSSEAGVWGRTL